MHQIKHILLIEDDPITTLIIKKLLQRKLPDSSLSTFNNGETALSYIRESQTRSNPSISLVLLDINMPVMDGWEFLDKLPQEIQNFKAPIIMLTSSIDRGDIKKSEQYSIIKGYFFKPINDDKLDQIITGVLAA